MFDRSPHDLENVLLQQAPKGGVAPSRFEIAKHQYRLNRLAVLEAENKERRRLNANARLHALSILFSNFLAKLRAFKTRVSNMGDSGSKRRLLGNR